MMNDACQRSLAGPTCADQHRGHAVLACEPGLLRDSPANLVFAGQQFKPEALAEPLAKSQDRFRKRRRFHLGRLSNNSNAAQDSQQTFLALEREKSDIP